MAKSANELHQLLKPAADGGVESEVAQGLSN